MVETSVDIRKTSGADTEFVLQEGRSCPAADQGESDKILPFQMNGRETGPPPPIGSTHVTVYRGL